MSCHVSIFLVASQHVHPTALSTQITHRFMKTLPSFPSHGFFSSAPSLQLLHKAPRDQFSDQCCLPQTALVLTSCCPALPSVLNSQDASNIKGATIQFCYCNNRFLQGGQKIGSSQTGQVLCFFICCFDTLSTQTYKPVRTGRDQPIKLHVSVPCGRSSCKTL